MKRKVGLNLDMSKIDDYETKLLVKLFGTRIGLALCRSDITYGLYDIKVINDKNSTKLGSYIMKLVNHATKETTKDKIITPRGEFSFPKLLKK